MKIAAMAVSAAVLGLLSIAPANALPSSSAITHATSHTGGSVEQVQFRRKGAYRKGFRRGYRQGYRSGHRYRRAPAGWRRYSARPYGWQTRGCVIVGPVWFCP